MDAEPPIVGIVTPPGWYDPTPAEFAALCARPVRTQQAIVDVPELDYDDLSCIAGALPEVRRAARLVAMTGARAVAMTGTPFVWAGLADEAAIRARLAGVAEAAGCATVMAGTAIVDALRALRATRIAVLAPYYTPAWRTQTERALAGCGFTVRAVRSADQLGLAASPRSIDDHAAASGEAIVGEGLRRLAAEAPDVEALVVAGAGARTLALTPSLERELGLPVVASDTALYRALAACLRMPLKPGRLGRMAATLD